MPDPLQLYRDGIEAWNRGDLEWFRDRVAEDLEVRPLAGIPGLDDVYRGWDGWEAFWGDWRDAWESVTIEFERLEDLGEEGVRALITFDGIGKGSGAAVKLVSVHLSDFDEQGQFTNSLTLWPDEAKLRWPDFDL